ncbi:MAG: uroporphyrinogen decarboxylase family protein [Planctomycetota bacterium]
MSTNRQWLYEVLSHKDGTAVPYNFMFSPLATQFVADYLGTDDINEALNLPIRMSACNTIKPLYANPKEYGRTITDEFGVTWTTSRIDRGSPVGPSLKQPSLDGFDMPQPAEEYRFRGLGRWCENNSKNFTIVWVGDLWERATFMRGMQDLLLDLSLNRSFVEKLLGGIANYILATMEILFSRFSFDAIALSDDYGTQQGMIMSPDTWRGLIKPLLLKIYAFARANNRAVFHHSCGNIRPIIGDMIEVGLDILHPIQPEAMDIFELKQQFGRDLTFCGGLNTQQLLPKATPQEIRHAVRQLKHRMGSGGGYILEPGITVQADVPLENIVAMIEEAQST